VLHKNTPLHTFVEGFHAVAVHTHSAICNHVAESVGFGKRLASQLLSAVCECSVRVLLQGAGGSGSFSAKRSPLGGKGLVHSDSTVQMQFHMAERMEENPRIWQVRPP
jgi:hypothetical protein